MRLCWLFHAPFLLLRFPFNLLYSPNSTPFVLHFLSLSSLARKPNNITHTTSVFTFPRCLPAYTTATPTWLACLHTCLTHSPVCLSAQVTTCWCSNKRCQTENNSCCSWATSRWVGNTWWRHTDHIQSNVVYIVRVHQAGNCVVGFPWHTILENTKHISLHCPCVSVENEWWLIRFPQIFLRGSWQHTLPA